MAKRPSIEGDASDQEPLLSVVGTRIKAARLRAKLKQSDVAAAIGTGQSYIVGLEAGETNITLKTLARVAAAVGVSPVALLVDSGPDDDAAVHLGKLLAAAIRDSDQVTDLLRQAHALVAKRDGGPGSDTPT